MEAVAPDLVLLPQFPGQGIPAGEVCGSCIAASGEAAEVLQQHTSRGTAEVTSCGAYRTVECKGQHMSRSAGY